MVATTLGTKSTAAAEITVTGSRDGGQKPFVLVNNDRALNGRTFFSGGTISTTGTSSANLNLGKLGTVTLSPNSELTLSFSDSRISGRLSNGSATVFNVDGVAVQIDTPHDSITNEATSSSRFSVSIVEGQTAVAVAAGNVGSYNGIALISKQDDDDDDDDDDWKGWAAAGVIAGIIGVVVVVIALSDDEDEVVSPVR
jgi:hypothetical protein